MGGGAWDELRAAARALRLDLPRGFEDQARQYLEELARWERVGRLTGYRGLQARVRHLLIDSLMLLSVVPEPGTPLLDIGSGAGVPGLVIKLARPAWAVTLLEAGRRRANFLRAAARALEIDVDVLQGRAETLGGGPLAGRFQTVTMRAVAPAPAAVGLAEPFLVPGGVVVLAAGPEAGGGPGRTVEVGGAKGLPWRRRFLIIPRAELDGDVSRGTLDAGPMPRRRQPEGRRREDDDRRQPGRSPRPR